MDNQMKIVCVYGNRLTKIANCVGKDFGVQYKVADYIIVNKEREMGYIDWVYLEAELQADGKIFVNFAIFGVPEAIIDDDVQLENFFAHETDHLVRRINGKDRDIKKLEKYLSKIGEHIVMRHFTNYFYKLLYKLEERRIDKDVAKYGYNHVEEQVSG